MDEQFSSDGFNWIGVRFLDPIGRVFFKDGFYYRAIYPEKVEFVKKVLDSKSYAELIKQNLMPEVETADINIDGFGMVLKTKALDWKLTPSSMTTATIKNAAINWIKINQILAEDNFALIDAHFGNIVLDRRARPVWIDLGSIQPIENISQGFPEFIQTHINPLFIFACKKNLNKLTRVLIDSHGFSIKETLSIIGYHHIKYNLVVAVLLFGKVLRKLKKNPAWYRKWTLAIFSKTVNSLNVAPKSAYWSKYRNAQLVTSDLEKFASVDSRNHQIINMAQSINPKSVIDIGANDGYFLSLIAQPGIKMMGIDPDEQAISKFANWIETLPDDKDVSACASVGTFYNTVAQAELVLGLALTHHLALTDKFKFDFIAKRFSEMSTKALLVEFMPHGMSGVEKPDHLPDWYRLDIFVHELNKYFGTVKVIDYERSKEYSPRIMIYCDAKK